MLLTSASQGALAAQSQDNIISACSGVSLPPSVVTDIMAPTLEDIVGPIETYLNNALSILETPFITFPDLSTDVSGPLADAAAGDPITLQALSLNGTLITSADDCVETADGYMLDDSSGLAIGGNRISGLGDEGRLAVSGEIDSIALGNGAETDASAAASIAIGTDSLVGASATGGVALGASATVTAANSVAIGAGSSSLRGAVASYSAPALTALQTSVGEVSIGSAGAERQLTNLAPGSADTDAVNVAQLTRVSDNVDLVSTQVGTLTFDLTALSDISVQYTDITRRQIDLGDGVNPVTVTNLADGAIASGSRDAVSGGQLYTVRTDLDDLTLQVDVVSTDLSTLNTAFGNVSDDVDLLNDLAVQYVSSARTAIVLGDGVQPVSVSNLADGAVDATSSDAVNGAQLFATNSALSVLSGDLFGLTGALTALDDVVVRYTDAGQTSVLLGDGLVPVRLNGLADGTIGAGATDAITGNQLNALGQDIARLISSSSTYDALTNTVLAQLDYGGSTYTDVQSVIGEIETYLLSLATTSSGGGDGASRYFNSTSVAPDSEARGTDSTAIGPSALADADGAIAAGRNTKAMSENSVAIGDGAEARDGKAVSIGFANVASGDGAVAIGDPNFATGDGAIALGKDNEATGAGAVALGNTNMAVGSGSLSIGELNTTNGETAIALGRMNMVSGNGAIAVGSNNRVTGNRSFAMGSNVQVTSDDTFAIGNDTRASGASSTAVGNMAEANGERSTAFGATASADGGYSLAVGDNAAALALESTALGARSTASGLKSLAVGERVRATADFATALGTEAAALDLFTLAVGQSARAESYGSTALGFRALSTAVGSVAIGPGSIASSEGSVALGGLTEAKRGAQTDYVAFGLAGLQRSASEVAVGQNISFIGPDGLPTPIAGRQITGVAPGSEGWDAVNVDQLRGIAEILGHALATGFGGGAFYDAALGQVTGPVFTINGADYGTVSSALNAITAMTGTGTGTAADSASPLGVTYDNGALTQLTLAGTSGTRLTNLAAGQVQIGSTDAVTGEQLFGLQQQIGGQNDDIAQLQSTLGALSAPTGLNPITYVDETDGATPSALTTNHVRLQGNGEDAVTISNVAEGRVAAGSTDAVNGQQLKETNDRIDLAALAAETAVEQSRLAVRYDSDDRNSVSLGTVGQPVRVRNVAPGVAPTDGVNVAQLNQGMMDAVHASMAYTDQRVALLTNELGDVRRRANAGTATALAAASLPQATQSGKGVLALGVAHYDGQNGIAVGFSRAMHDARTLVRVGGTYDSQGRFGTAAGVGWQF
ncbi:YadA-like family protein [Parvularcula sp. LCG005]|uniref:YadA-like family protein n=1 Tax=Parvularcula sp. LCG005 TaxID=3078805 RepID=UPI00294284FF|nr:YadA-like family protein [Parvularcula sp. LCG005]WOI53104.1 YadA-like family protein [Parvularcula sp. LCG005]